MKISTSRFQLRKIPYLQRAFCYPENFGSAKCDDEKISIYHGRSVDLRERWKLFHEVIATFSICVRCQENVLKKIHQVTFCTLGRIPLFQKSSCVALSRKNIHHQIGKSLMMAEKNLDLDLFTCVTFPAYTSSEATRSESNHTPARRALIDHSKDGMLRSQRRRWCIWSWGHDYGIMKSSYQAPFQFDMSPRFSYRDFVAVKRTALKAILFASLLG